MFGYTFTPGYRKLLAKAAFSAALILGSYGASLAFDPDATSKRLNEVGLEVNNKPATPESVSLGEAVSIDTKHRGVTKADLELICGMPKLRRLSMDGAYFIKKDWLEALANCTGLEDVSLGRLIVGPKAAAIIGGMPKLKKLLLNQTRGLTDESFASIAKSPSIAQLYINFSQLSDASLASISQMQQLKILELDDSRGFSAKSVELLAQIKSLEFLKLTKVALFDETLKAFENHPSLKHLILSEIYSISD